MNETSNVNKIVCLDVTHALGDSEWRAGDPRVLRSIEEDKYFFRMSPPAPNLGVCRLGSRETTHTLDYTSHVAVVPPSRGMAYSFSTKAAW